MKHADFVHLHNHSDYSLLDGASSIPGMVHLAAEMKMPALALTDHGAMFGAVEFYNAARKAGVKPIIGMEAYVARTSRTDRSKPSAHHLVLLARDEQGFRNLMRLSSLAFLEGFYYKPRVDHDILAQHAGGLLALSACPQGEIAADLLDDRDEQALETAMMYRDMFGAENYFLEVQNHGLDIETKIREKVRALSTRTGIPIVATNDCHYLKAEDTDAQDLLLCIQTGKTVNDAQRMRALAGLHFRAPAEMEAAFGDFQDALRNTLAVAERCNLQMQFGKPLLPEFPLPPGKTADEVLAELAWAGLRERCGEVGDEAHQRFEYELGVIAQMGFSSYFLIVHDFIHFAKSRGIGVGPGRGSVAGSLVAFALRITDVDPLRYGLIFERFLNPGRVSMPDIDIDFDDLRRHEVIDYVKEKYGESSVTQIITFGTMGAKGVVRDVARALGMPPASQNELAKLVPDGLGMTLDKALELSPDLKNLPQRGPEFERLLRTAKTLEGLARHASTHAAGVLITPGPLLDHVPLYRQKDESVTTQWDMKSVEKAGLLKMDFLGLRTLSVLQECVALAKQHHGVEIDLEKLPMDDGAAYQVFQDGDTVAIFQFESTGMRDYLRKLKPTVFEDLIAMNALYRPGPMENIPYFIDCKHGRQVARYEHPGLEPILKGTYGVFVYQEQVMAAANRLAGFTMAQADELRRAMGKKLVEEMEAKRKAFIEGCVHHKSNAAKAEKIFATMEKFAGYGFNKCVVGETLVDDARSGRRWRVDEIFRDRPVVHVHALGEDWRLRPRRVLDVVSNGARPVFELRTRQGKRITATGNHPFRTLDGWTNLEDLRVGDRIAAPRRLTASASAEWPRHEVIALAGLLAEGDTCHPTTLYFYGNDPVLVADFAAAIGAFPETVARIDARRDGRLEVAANLGRFGYAREGDDGYEGIATDGSLALALDRRRSGAFRWAEALGIVGRKATEKRVPAPVFELAEAQLELFLGRLWAGDGYFAGEGHSIPCYATSSPELAREVQALLSRLGIMSGVHGRRFEYRGGHRVGHVVNLHGNASIRTFLERVAPHALGRERQVDLLRGHLERARPGRGSRDLIPVAVLHRVAELRRAKSLTVAELESAARAKGLRCSQPRAHRRSGIRRDTLARVADALGTDALRDLATSDVHWDEIVAIEPRGIQETYDLTVEGDHNFVADGLIVHNSHSAAYALVAYQCAWLKAHHPAEFMAATLTSEMADTARILTLIEECRRMGIRVLPPDINRSRWKFTIEDGAIRYGLGAVKNVGQGAIEALVAARDAGASFSSLWDLASRCDSRTLNRRVLESLVGAGACDALGGERGALFAAAGRALEQAAALAREKASGQSSLFGEGSGAVAVVAPALPSTPPWTSRERSAREKESLGFYLTEHPLEHLRERLARLATHSVADALTLEHETEVRLAGLIGEIKNITTKSGKLMAIVALEDLTGRIECTVFPDVHDQVRPRLVIDEVVVVSGRIEVRDDRGVKLLLADLKPLEDAAIAYRAALHIEVRAEELDERRLEDIDGALSAHPGEAEVYLHIVRPDHSRLAMRSRRYRVSEDDTVITTLRERCPGLRARWGKGAA
jgi:DNA polymerase III subunit alpha